MNEISFGAIESPLDGRDHEDVTLSGLTETDSYFTDLSKLRVRMQHKVGKCTGSSTAKATDRLLGIDSSDDFLYRGTKDKIDLNLTEGSSIRSVLKFAQKHGVCRRDTWEIPVNATTTYLQYLMSEIPEYAYDEAKKYRIGRYYSVPVDITLLKAAIRKHGLVIARMEVGSEWYSPSWSASDILPLRRPHLPISGHAIILYGFSTDPVTGKTSFYLANSWSKAWAANGNGYFVFEDYRPTEAWVATMEPIPGETEDRSPVIEETTWKKLLTILKGLSIIK
jgi:hypothetical protein